MKFLNVEKQVDLTLILSAFCATNSLSDGAGGGSEGVTDGFIKEVQVGDADGGGDDFDGQGGLAQKVRGALHAAIPDIADDRRSIRFLKKTAQITVGDMALVR